MVKLRVMEKLGNKRNKKLAHASRLLDQIAKKSERIAEKLEEFVEEELPPPNQYGYILDERPCKKALARIESQIRELSLSLEYHRKPEVVRTVKSKYYEILDIADSAEGCHVTFSNEPTVEHTYVDPNNVKVVKSCATDFAKCLRRIAAMAREERNEAKHRRIKAILYLIGGLVTIFAALLGIVYYLWWLWTKFSA